MKNIRFKRFITCIISCIMFIGGLTVYADTVDSKILHRETVYLESSDYREITCNCLFTENKITFNLMWENKKDAYNSAYKDYRYRADEYGVPRVSIKYDDTKFNISASANKYSFRYAEDNNIYEEYYFDNRNYNVSYLDIELVPVQDDYIISDSDIFELAGVFNTKNRSYTGKYVIINCGEFVEYNINQYIGASKCVVQSSSEFGDINFDGSIDAKDAQQLLSFYVSNLSGKDVGTLIQYTGNDKTSMSQNEIDSMFDFKTVLIDNCNEFAERIYYLASKWVYLNTTGTGVVCDIPEDVSDDVINDVNKSVNYDNIDGFAWATIEFGGTNSIWASPYGFIDPDSDAVCTWSFLQEYNNMTAFHRLMYYLSATTNDETRKYTNALVEFNEDGTVKGVAIQDSNNYLGCYPNKMTLDNYNNLDSHDAQRALAYSYS